MFERQCVECGNMFAPKAYEQHRAVCPNCINARRRAKYRNDPEWQRKERMRRIERYHSQALLANRPTRPRGVKMDLHPTSIPDAPDTANARSTLEESDA